MLISKDIEDRIIEKFFNKKYNEIEDKEIFLLFKVSLRIIKVNLIKKQELNLNYETILKKYYILFSNEIISKEENNDLIDLINRIDNHKDPEKYGKSKLAVYDIYREHKKQIEEMLETLEVFINF